MHFLPALLLTASHTDPITGMTGMVSDDEIKFCFADDPANGYVSPKDVYYVSPSFTYKGYRFHFEVFRYLTLVNVVASLLLRSLFLSSRD